MTIVCSVSEEEDLGYIIELETLSRHGNRKDMKRARDELKEFRKLYNYPKEKYSCKECRRLLGYKQTSQ